MNAMKGIRIIAWALIAVIVAGIAFYLIDNRGGGAVPPLSASFGGPFTLTSTKGDTVTDAALSGHPSALFFGYTYCPDVCPTTLTDLTGYMQKLGAAADRLKIYFVTVDPARDTREQMASYLSAFDPRITGLTGTQVEIDQIVKDYRVYARKVGDGDNYTMDHTATVYLLNDKAQFVGTIDYQEKEETAMAKLKRLVGA